MSLYEGLIHDKLALVLEIGARYTKLGFAGEYSPRAIIRTEVKCALTKEVRRVFEYDNEDHLYSLVVEFIHGIFFRYLLVTPKDRHVVIVESVLCPTIIRETLAKVLFHHFEVGVILFAPSHLVALCPLGLKTALVVDIGHTEAQIIPVYEGVPVLCAWQAQPIGSQAVEERLKLGIGQNDVDSSLLSDEIVEDIRVRGCFVTNFERGKSYAEENPPKPPRDMKYPIRGETCITIPGTIRETCYEVLFEKDNDQSSLPYLILDSILKCSIDSRKELLENLLIVGGISMAPGFKHRLLTEIRDLLNKQPYCNKLPLKTVKIHSSKIKENIVSWLGGAIYGATDMIALQGLTRNKYNMLQCVPDWFNLVNNALAISKIPA